MSSGVQFAPSSSLRSVRPFALTKSYSEAYSAVLTDTPPTANGKARKGAAKSCM